MKKYTTWLLVIAWLNGLATTKINNKDNQYSYLTSDEIVFYTNGSVFSPVIVLQEDAEILWIWDDNLTTNSASPTKDYGSDSLRKNRLKVTPWSAVRRINIGYDAQDGGSPEIELVGNQYVSKVENLNLVAPYLKEWCSSHSMITSLDFSNFVNLETIESHLSQYLQSINLTNTPKLKRACFVVNGLINLDLSDCSNLEEILAGCNKLTKFILPQHADNIWYIGARENFQLSNQYIYNDLSRFPNISHLSVWESNQKGDLIIPKTNPTQWVWLRAYGNQYSSIDLRGAMQNENSIGLVDMHNNKLTKVEIGGCKQIRTLDLSQNLLSADTVDYVLKQLDELGPTILSGTVNLCKNHPPTAQGLIYKANLEAKGWEVMIDTQTSINDLTDSDDFSIYPNPSNGKFHIRIDDMPGDGVLMEIRNVAGQKLLEQKIIDTNTEWSVNQYSGNMFFITLKGTHILATKRIIIR